MSEEVKYQVIRQFGPSVFKVRIPQTIIDHLNKYVDKMVLDKKKKVDLNWGHKLVGDVTEEFLLEKILLKKVVG